jgi:hypothetical protein
MAIYVPLTKVSGDQAWSLWSREERSNPKGEGIAE